MIRTLISVPEVESLQWLGENCGVPDLGKVAGTMSVTVSDVTELTRKCMVYQGVLADAAEMHADAKRQEQQAQQDGSEDEAFKPLQWTVVHGAASFSDPAILDAALAVEPYIAAALEKKHTQHRSKGNQWQSADDRAAPQTTPMHIAAIRGNTRLIELLVKNGHPTNAADRWGRIPLEYACLQMWTPLELTAAFGASALEYCNEMGTLTLRRPGIGEDAHADVAANRNRSSVRDGGSGGSGGGGGGNPNQEYAPFEYVEAGGGFQTPTENAKIPSTCDFDIVTKMTVAEFQHTYGGRCCCAAFRKGRSGTRFARAGAKQRLRLRTRMCGWRLQASRTLKHLALSNLCNRCPLPNTLTRSWMPTVTEAATKNRLATFLAQRN